MSILFLKSDIYIMRQSITAGILWSVSPCRLKMDLIVKKNSEVSYTNIQH